MKISNDKIFLSKDFIFKKLKKIVLKKCTEIVQFKNLNAS